MNLARIRKVIFVSFLAALGFGLLSAPGYAQVQPGDFITPENASKVKNLVSPGAYYKVERGMTMKIISTQRVDWPPPYKDATEKYSGQVRLTANHRSLAGYVAGQPFPMIDPNDPYAATKIIWNNAYRPLTSDDYDLRFYDCDSEYQARGVQSKQIGYFQIGHYAGYNLVGRTEVEPLPIDPNFKESGRLWMFGLYPVLAPNELHGVGIIRWRYADAGLADDTWAINSGSRRVRRLNESILSSTSASGTAAFTTDPDHYSGFNPKTEEYSYRLLGEKNMLGSVHAEHSPLVRCPTDGGASVCPEVWEMRHIYVVEATPRPGFVSALESKTLIYMDSEAWFEPFVDTYDQKGELFRAHIFYLTYRDRPVPDAKVAIYPFKREFVLGTVSTDVQSGLATVCYLPGIETPERECWYINMGAVDRSFFTADALVRAANF